MNVKNYKTISRLVKKDTVIQQHLKFEELKEEQSANLSMYSPLMVSFYSNSRKEMDN